VGMEMVQFCKSIVCGFWGVGGMCFFESGLGFQED